MCARCALSIWTGFILCLRARYGSNPQTLGRNDTSWPVMHLSKPRGSHLVKDPIGLSKTYSQGPQYLHSHRRQRPANMVLSRFLWPSYPTRRRACPLGFTFPP
ncbi:hypothetical protein L226DRAFT_255153 [Lentinus tigrinus ALCF2SS1-7]|uniref:uncharacterized protein n=1 Tax=Lentinus tigrinus ALCF2SS1-7 TaxID=1328758 RepID=UPI0011663E35|nr:hypothetical protein L226DRAFT_255153 [Lentinus tigrinus ALCF2SS1-7]